MTIDARARQDGRARRFSRRLGLALVVGIVAAMLAASGASTWMARKQDALAADANRRMIAGGLAAFAEGATTLLLDYALWTAAHDKVLADDRDWVYENIGSSAGIGTFDLAIILPIDGPDYGWRSGGGEAPRHGLLDPAAIDAAKGLLDDVAVDSGSAHATFVRSAGELWLLAIARIVPHDGVPEGLADGDLPRQIVGFRITAATMHAIGEDFLIADLELADAPKPGFGSVALNDAGGAPLAYAVWTPPTPGRAVLRAALLPLAGLMLLLAGVALLVSRELVGSARRLEAALDRAQAADRSKTQFLANVTHELRTPMNGVIGIAQLLQMQDLGPEAREMLGVLLASARAQVQLINGLLDITRIETGSMALDAAPFDPAAAVDETIRLLAPEAQAKGLALTATIAPAGRAAFVGDALALRQVLVNLVGNAIKFTDAGGVDVDLAARAGADGLALTVADTGRGIAPEDQARIFERFVQVDGSLTRSAGGAGLGLAITRSLVELMGGTIRVDSAPGRGATFMLSLPLARAGSARPLAA